MPIVEVIRNVFVQWGGNWALWLLFALERSTLESRLSFLGTLGNNAPFIVADLQVSTTFGGELRPCR